MNGIRFVYLCRTLQQLSDYLEEEHRVIMDEFHLKSILDRL